LSVTGGSVLSPRRRPPQVQDGRAAREPEEIPAQGWRDVAWRVARRLGPDNVKLVAGGVAFYSLLSVFPGLAAVVSVYGLFASPATLRGPLHVFAWLLPPSGWELLSAQLQSVASYGFGTLTAAAVFGLLLALWGAHSAMASLMTATNIAYGEQEKRSWIGKLLLSFAFTGGAILGFLGMLVLSVAVPLTLRALGVSVGLRLSVHVLRLVLLWASAIVALALIYRYAPARSHARWKWVTWGSVVAASLWLGASAVFAFYLRRFGTLGASYGALGGFTALVLWFYISSVLVVLGAEINAEMERQTCEDTTVRAGAPLGQRGAYAADTVGPGIGEPAGAREARFGRKKSVLEGR
jgi:membrane protein